MSNSCISFLLQNVHIVFSALRKKINTEGDVPPSMSGSCAVCVDRVLYLFGGHHSRGNTNKVSVSKDYGLRQFYSFTLRQLEISKVSPHLILSQLNTCM